MMHGKVSPHLRLATRMVRLWIAVIPHEQRSREMNVGENGQYQVEGEGESARRYVPPCRSDIKVKTRLASRVAKLATKNT